MLPDWIKLTQQDDGVVTLEVATGKNDNSVPVSALMQEVALLNDHRFHLDTAAIEKALQGKMGFKGKVIYPRDAALSFTLSADQMIATGILSPPEGGAAPNAAALIAAVQARGLTVGLKEDVIHQMVDNQEYDVPTVIAEGIPPTPAVDGGVEPAFGGKKGAPGAEEGGKVDYRALDTIVSVAAGDPILRVTPPQEGVAGQTVTGKAIPVARPKPLKLRLGKGVRYSDESHTLVVSEVEGVPSVRPGIVEVNPLVEVSGDVDFKVGNVNSHGALHIRGSVLPGFVVQSTGDIIIDGIVDSARVESTGGSVVIRGGVAGHNKAAIQAAGDVQALYVDKATVLCEGNLTVDEAVLHSTLMAFGDITVTAKRGQVIGGLIRCGGTLRVNDLGAVAHPATTVQVGGNPKIMVERESIQSTLAELTKMVDEQQKNVSTLEKKTTQARDEVSAEQKKKVLEESKVALQNSQHQVTDYLNRMKLLEDHLMGAEKHTPKVIVNRTAFPGVNISIKNATYKILRESDHMQFVNLNGEVAMQPA